MNGMHIYIHVCVYLEHSLYLIGHMQTQAPDPSGPNLLDLGSDNCSRNDMASFADFSNLSGGKGTNDDFDPRGLDNVD